MCVTCDLHDFPLCCMPYSMHLVACRVSSDNSPPHSSIVLSCVVCRVSCVVRRASCVVRRVTRQGEGLHQTAVRPSVLSRCRVSCVICRVSCVVCRVSCVVLPDKEKAYIRQQSAPQFCHVVVCRVSCVVCRVSCYQTRRRPTSDSSPPLSYVALSCVMCRVSCVVCRMSYVVCRVTRQGEGLHQTAVRPSVPPSRLTFWPRLVRVLHVSRCVTQRAVVPAAPTRCLSRACLSPPRSPSLTFRLPCTYRILCFSFRRFISSCSLAWIISLITFALCSLCEAGTY